MALYPESQRTAQAELDSLNGAMTGHEELPQASDLSRLHYLPALLKEILRFAPVANIGVFPHPSQIDQKPHVVSAALPHRVTQNDEYSGYRIPKNATVIANVW